MKNETTIELQYFLCVEKHLDLWNKLNQEFKETKVRFNNAFNSQQLQHAEIENRFANILFSKMAATYDKYLVGKEIYARYIFNVN